MSRQLIELFCSGWASETSPNPANITRLDLQGIKAVILML